MSDLAFDRLLGAIERSLESYRDVRRPTKADKAVIKCLEDLSAFAMVCVLCDDEEEE